jgi:hypothetical protein
VNTEARGFECTNRFYTIIAFQRHKVCNFWIYGLKDMNFARFQVFEFYLNLIELGCDTCHVLVCPYWFGRITNLGRWILLDLGELDHPVPLHLSERIRVV